MMAKDFVITCPHCSKTFSAQDFIKDHLTEAKKESIENQKKFKAGYAHQSPTIHQDKDRKSTRLNSSH